MLSFYEKWISGPVLEGDRPFTRDAIEDYQLEQLRKTLRYVKDKSKFYAHQLMDLDVESIQSLDDFAANVPFTCPEDLARSPGIFSAWPNMR